MERVYATLAWLQPVAFIQVHNRLDPRSIQRIRPFHSIEQQQDTTPIHCSSSILNTLSFLRSLTWRSHPRKSMQDHAEFTPALQLSKRGRTDFLYHATPILRSRLRHTRVKDAGAALETTPTPGPRSYPCTSMVLEIMD